MRKLTTGAALTVACLLAATGLAVSAPKSMTFTMSTVTDAQGMHVNVKAKVWVKGTKARVETNHPMSGPMVMLVNGARLHRLYPQRKQGVVGTIDTGKNGPKNPWEFIVANVNQITRDAKKVGQQKIDGHLCDVYQMTRKGPGGTMKLKAWITRATQPRLPLKVEETVQVKRPNMTVSQTQTTRITGLRFGVAIPDSLFKVPSGYKVVQADVAGAPGLPVGPGAGAPGLRP